MPYKNKDVQREFQRKWIASKRELFFRDKCCRKCGSKESLELDHIDTTEKWSHRIWSYTWTRIMKEAAKCQVLCKSCHAEKTEKDRELWKVHGTLACYMKSHCRCDECKSFKNVEPSELREYDMYSGAQ